MFKVMINSGGLLLLLAVNQAWALRPANVNEVESSLSQSPLSLISSHVSSVTRARDTAASFASFSLGKALLQDSVSSSIAADMELGSDFEVLAETQLDSASRGGGNLKEYCSGGGGMQKDLRVEADWKNYGTFYPGKVKDVNEDGTVDILYDDGFTEKRVEAKNFHIVEEVKRTPPKDDPACEVSDDLDSIKLEVKKTNEDVAAWLAAKRAKNAGRSTKRMKKTTTPLPDVSAPAPAPASIEPSDDAGKNAKLEELKLKLAAKDEEIRQLEEEVLANDDEIRAVMEDQNEKKHKVRTIEDLIAEYESLIARRQEWIDFLTDKQTKQNDQLTSLGFGAVSLEDIDKSVEGIELDVGRVEKKRNAMEKADRLDPELGAAIENMIKQVAKLRSKLTLLIAADKKAELARRRAEEKAQARAAEAAAAEKEDNEEDAAAKRWRRMQEEAAANAEAREMEAAEEEVLNAANDVDDELHAVDESSKELDSGVVPHGDKWWRYRYEHSFVEAVLVIFILFLVLFWERFFHYLRGEMYKRSDMDAFQWMEHSTMYLSWLQFFTGELMVCLLVFLTVWLFGKLKLLHYFTLVLVENEHMHLPDKGSEYEHIAIDMCVVLFWAICLYFVLALSIVHASMSALSDWADLDEQSQAGIETPTAPTAYRIFSIASTPREWGELKNYTWLYLKNHGGFADVISADMERGVTSFPLWAYLRANVRDGTNIFFQFGVLPWCLIIGTFVVFMYLHYYMHMGYIRIMSFFLVLLIVQLLAVVWFVRGISGALAQDLLTPRESAMKTAPRSIHTEFSTEKIIATSCFYNLFILCYGISRVVCQPWMWELHFWVAANILAWTVIMVIVFCVFIAPLFPVFLAVLSLPPYIDDDNAVVLKEVLTEGAVGAASFRVLAKGSEAGQVLKKPLTRNHEQPQQAGDSAPGRAKAAAPAPLPAGTPESSVASAPAPTEPPAPVPAPAPSPAATRSPATTPVTSTTEPQQPKQPRPQPQQPQPQQPRQQQQPGSQAPQTQQPRSQQPPEGPPRPRPKRSPK